MQAFLESLPNGNFISIESLQAWARQGKGPSEGGVLDVHPIASLTADEVRELTLVNIVQRREIDFFVNRRWIG